MPTTRKGHQTNHFRSPAPSPQKPITTNIPECQRIPGSFFLLPQRFHQFLKAIHRGLQVFYDIRSQHIWIGEAVEVCQGFVLDPEEVEAGFVPLEDLVGGEFAPAAVGVGFGPGFVAVVAVFGVVAADEVG